VGAWFVNSLRVIGPLGDRSQGEVSTPYLICGPTNTLRISASALLDEYFSPAAAVHGSEEYAASFLTTSIVISCRYLRMVSLLSLLKLGWSGVPYL
jgi:hypothetical protein